MYKFKLLILMWLYAANGFSQNIKITGKVQDENGVPLPGANVIVKESKSTGLIGTVTDPDGKYTIEAPSNSTLVFSFVGLKSSEIPIDAKTSIDVTLMSNQLDEVMVVGFGQQKKESVVGSIVQTSGNDLVKAGGVTSMSQALTGLLPGVLSIQKTSEPGADGNTLLIRGRSTWQNAAPLILVDGIERSFDDINPNEIDKVSVLKDASATAVFGARGANGVILVTTKRGSSSKPQINFSADMDVKQPTSRFSYNDHYKSMELANVAYKNDRIWSNMITPDSINLWKNNVNPLYYPNINWYDEVVKKYTIGSNYNFNVSGGSDVLRYFASVGYLYDSDIFKTEKQPEYDPAFFLKQYNFRSNLDFNVTKTTTLSVNLSGKIGIQNAPQGMRDSKSTDLETWGHQEFFRKVYHATNYLFPIQYPDGTYGDRTGASGDATENAFVQLNKQGSRELRSTVLFTDISLKQDLGMLIKGLEFRGKVSYNSNFVYIAQINKEILRVYYSGPNDTIGTKIPSSEFVERPASVANEEIKDNYTKDLYYEGSLNFARTISKHDITALFLFFRRQRENQIDFPSYQESWVSRVTYGYNNIANIELNGAYNGSEKFAPHKKFGFFPSIGLGLNIAQLEFFKNNVSFVEKFRLRYSYGEVGNDWTPSDQRFAYISGFTSGGNVPFGNPRQNYGPLYTESRLANPDATWEVAKKRNYGFEIRLFNKLNFSADFFTENRDNILMTVFMSARSGAQQSTGNIGKTKSKGYELEGEWKQAINKDFWYTLKSNFTFYENRIIFRQDPPTKPEFLREAGKPINWQSSIYANGYYQTWDDIYNYPNSDKAVPYRIPGDIKYVDYNGDGKIDTYDAAPMKDLTEPQITYGFTLGFAYKSLEFSAMFYGVGMVQKNIPSALYFPFERGDLVSHAVNTDYWTPENPNASMPSLHYNQNGNNDMGSNFLTRDASYLRLRTLEISYTLTPKVLKSAIGINKLQIFANGNNLITWTSFDSRLDPESTLNYYPIVRRYNIGVRLSL